MEDILLETRRLAFRRMTRDDLDFVAEMLAHPEVMHYYPQCYSRDEAALWIDRQLGRYLEHGVGLWLVSNRETGEPIGQIGPTPNEFGGVIRIEVSYLVHRPFWGRGYATEGAIAVRDYIFNALDLDQALCMIRPENAPSRAVAKKAGFTQVPDQIVRRSGFDHWVYTADRLNLTTMVVDAKMS